MYIDVYTFLIIIDIINDIDNTIEIIFGAEAFGPLLNC